MADNVTITAGSGTTIAADDVGGALHQRVKVTWGADGTGTDVNASTPLPVVQTGVPALPTGPATEATALLIKAAAEDTSTINVAQDVAIMKNGAASLTPKFAAISASTSGDNTIVAAVTGKKIRVLAYNLMGAGAVNGRFQTAAAGAYLTGFKYIAAAGGGICAPFNPVGWFETVAGDLLNLELSAAVAVGGEIIYVEV